MPRKRNVKWGRNGKRSVYNKYNGLVLRSLLERRWAMAMDEVGLFWSYEPIRVELGNFSYLPDFYLPSLEAYAEVKPGFPEAAEMMAGKLLCEWADCPVYFFTSEPEENQCYVFRPTPHAWPWVSFRACERPF